MSTHNYDATELQALRVANESLRQQLDAALAACKGKDESLRNILELSEWAAEKVATEALAIQPDDSALKWWLGEPVAWKDINAKNRVIFPPMKPEKDDDGWLPLYSPKGLK